MGYWKKPSSAFNGEYHQVIKEGFILTIGRLHLSFEGHPFEKELSLNYPSFQLLKVHRNHPIETIDTGKITIRPKGDQRPSGEYVRDKNPNVYDTVTLFLAPYELDLPEKYPRESFSLDGFIRANGTRTPATLVYIDKGELKIDHSGIQTVSSILPTQIPEHLNYWLYHAGKLQAYHKNAHSHKEIGRFDLTQNRVETIEQLVQKLEKRFKTKIRTRRP